MPMMHPEDEANSDAPIVPDLRPTNRNRPTRRIDDRSTTQTHLQMEDRPDRPQRTGPQREIPASIRRELATIDERLSNIEARLTDEEGRR